MSKPTITTSTAQAVTIHIYAAPGAWGTYTVRENDRHIGWIIEERAGWVAVNLDPDCVDVDGFETAALAAESLR